MTTQQENKLLPIPEPNNSEEQQQLSKQEIKENLDKYWKLIDSAKNWEDYKSAWDNYDHFTELKTKLYK